MALLKRNVSGTETVREHFQETQKNTLRGQGFYIQLNDCWSINAMDNFLFFSLFFLEREWVGAEGERELQIDSKLDTEPDTMLDLMT